MPRFRYEAKRNPVDWVRGTVVAEEKKGALEQVSRMGYTVVALEEEGGSSASSAASLTSFFRRVGLKEVTSFTRQLADMLESGIPIARALDLLQQQTGSPVFKTAIQDIKEQCIGGLSLSAAMERHPQIFSSLIVLVTRAGETAGALGLSLKRLSDFGEKQLEMRMRVRSAMAYPLLMAFVGFATVLVLLIFVVPRMLGIFEDLGQALPLPTRILLWVSGALTHNFVAWVLGVVALGWVAIQYFRTPGGRQWLDGARLRMPIVGPLFKKVELARFSQTLATLLSNGVPMLEALRVSAGTVGNRLLKNEFEASATAVKSGSRLSEALAQGQLIPAAVAQMIAVGEESGRLESTLQKISETFERESDQAIKVMMSLLEPLMILALGLVVGLMVLAILLPVFEISLSAK